MNSKFFELKRRLKQGAIQTGLEAFSIGSDLGFYKNAGGYGAIFTLHRVEPHRKTAFQPNAHLSITPEFLDLAIDSLKQKGFEAISLQHLPRYLADPNPARKIMCFTLDDGYLNNATHALPIFEKHNVPFTLFPCSGFIERTHFMWWEVLEQLIGHNDVINIDLPNTQISMRAVTPAQKYLAFDVIGPYFIGSDQRAICAQLAECARKYQIDIMQLVDDLIMNRQDLRKIAEHPLVTIGAHTVSHCVLSHLSQKDLHEELTQSVAHLTDLLGERPTSFAYPYGGRTQAGLREFEAVHHADFNMALMTTPNVLNDQTRMNMYQLPRISLNGYYQKAQYVDALASGAIFKFLKAG